MLKKTRDIFILNLIDLRQKRGLTQSDVAEAAGVNLRTYQKYEYKKAFPEIEKYDLIAKRLGVSVADLFMGDDYMGSPKFSMAELTLDIEDSLRTLTYAQLEVIKDNIKQLKNPAPSEFADDEIADKKSKESR